MKYKFKINQKVKTTFSPYHAGYIEVRFGLKSGDGPAYIVRLEQPYASAAHYDSPIRRAVYGEHVLQKVS